MNKQKSVDEIREVLSAQVPRHMVRWLPKTTKKKNGAAIERNGVQVAMCVAYIDAATAQNILDSAVGVDNWWDAYEDGPDGSWKCYLTVRIGDQTIVKPSYGVPTSEPNKVKSAETDAFKRAASKFGVGRNLIDLGDRWIPFDGFRTQGPTPDQIALLVILSEAKGKPEGKLCRHFSENRANYFEELTRGEASICIKKLEETDTGE